MYKKLALCIGNDDYQFTCLDKLQYAVNDSRVMTLKLEQLGFDVIKHSNLNRDEMHQAVDDFEEALADYDVGLFYYAGHGFECDGNNLLMPIDTAGTDKGYRDWMALKLETVINSLEGRNVPNKLKTKIIILDACRQNLSGRGASHKGFASVFAPKGSLIAFSTSPGQLAKERNGHGLYTKALLQHIDIPRIPIENMFKHVRETLDADTNGQQVSWEHTSLMGNFYFNEDRIDSGTTYSKEALVDKEYYFNQNNPIREIVEKLKSHDWYEQNPAIHEIPKIDFQNASANDLFVLGRNIYQSSAGGSWSSQRFIDDFADMTDIINDAKAHILNGMAYEIYFNKNGLLRDEFKSDNYLGVLRLLEMEFFQRSRLFITEKLSAIENRIIYIPGSEERSNFYVMCHPKEESDGKSIFHVDSIHFNGKKVLHTLDEEHSSRRKLNQKDLKKAIAKEIIAPLDMLILTYNIEITVNAKFAMPYYFCLSYSPSI